MTCSVIVLSSALPAEPDPLCPPRVLVNASREPSGDHTGVPSASSPAVSWRAGPPSVGGQPDGAAVAVGVEVDAADDVRDGRAVRRDGGLLDADKAGDV